MRSLTVTAFIVLPLALATGAYAQSPASAGCSHQQLAEAGGGNGGKQPVYAEAGGGNGGKAPRLAGANPCP
jgi:hypothetical protein